MTMTEAPRHQVAPSIDPRLRQRWVDARREEGRRRLRVLVSMASVILVIVAGLGVLYSPIMRVRHVRVSLGTIPAGSGLTVQGIVAQAGLAGQQLMVRVSPNREAALVEALPWIDTARVQRVWPGTVRITATTRKAVAQVDRIPGHPEAGTALVDASGRVLALATRGLTDLPLLASLPAPGAPGTWIAHAPGSAPGPGAAAGSDPGTATAEVLTTAAALPAALDRQVSTIQVASSGLTLEVGGRAVLFGDTSQLGAKVAALQTLVSEVSLVGVQVIDLRVADRPALTPSHGTTNLSTIAGG